MSKPERRLGRGLSSLIQATSAPAPPSTDKGATQSDALSPNSPPKSEQPVRIRLPSVEHAIRVDDLDEMRSPVESPPATDDRRIRGEACWLPIEEIAAGAQQPRRLFDAQSIAQLAASIARNGMVQPLVVRPVRDGRRGAQGVVKYELVAGERRWRASRAAGLDSVPAIVRDVDDERALELALIENLQREDLNAMDRAEAYSNYCHRFGLRPEEVATRLSEDRTTVVNYLRLLELPPEVKEMVSGGTLSMGHARAVLGLADAAARVDLARAAVVNGLSVRALEEIVRRRRGRVEPDRDKLSVDASDGQSARRETAPQIAHVERCFQQALGTKVKVRPGRGKGRGRIMIEYYSLDDFDRIADRLGVKLD